MRQRLLALAVGATALAAPLAAQHVHGQSATAQVPTASAHHGRHHDRTYEIGLIGDMPYGPTGREQFPRVVADMNRHHLAFSTFDGDLKSGSERCDQWQYDLAAATYASFRDPLVYVPGDNEWTDCDRASNGGYDPNERLALVRRMFASGPTSLGQRTIRLTRQSAQYPENVRWQLGGITYAGLNVPGSDNNAPQYDAGGKQVDGDLAEYTARNAANLAWIDETFAAARRARSAAVMIVVQADMWNSEDPAQPSPHYADTKRELARQTLAYDGQVLLVNGDSHFLQVDKPLKDAKDQTIESFTRVQTFGSDQDHWVSATVDVRDPQVFTVHQHVVRANEPAYVAP